MTVLPDGAYARLVGWSKVHAAGPDAAKFLHNFCTNDVLKLDVGAAREAFFTDAKAHVLAYGWVHRAEAERFDVLLSSSRAETLRAHLDRYLIREKVDLAATGPEDLALLNAESSGAPVTAYGPSCRVTSLDEIGDRQELSSDAFHALRIKLRIPLDGIDVDERNLPQEVDRNDAAISFTKGCYLGQEPVARIDALGRVNWLLRAIEVEGPPPAAGDEILVAEKVVGRVTSSVAFEGGALALCYLRREAVAGSALLTVGGQSCVVLSGG